MTALDCCRAATGVLRRKKKKKNPQRRPKRRRQTRKLKFARDFFFFTFVLVEVRKSELKKELEKALLIESRRGGEISLSIERGGVLHGVQHPLSKIQKRKNKNKKSCCVLSLSVANFSPCPADRHFLPQEATDQHSYLLDIAALSCLVSSV